MTNIVKCKDCGGQVSTNADKCPHCGSTLFSNTQVAVLFIALIVAIWLGVTAYFAIGDFIDELPSQDAEQVEVRPWE